MAGGTESYVTRRSKAQAFSAKRAKVRAFKREVSAVIHAALWPRFAGRKFEPFLRDELVAAVCVAIGDRWQVRLDYEFDVSTEAGRVVVTTRIDRPPSF